MQFHWCLPCSLAWKAAIVLWFSLKYMVHYSTLAVTSTYSEPLEEEVSNLQPSFASPWTGCQQDKSQCKHLTRKGYLFIYKHKQINKVAFPLDVPYCYILDGCKVSTPQSCQGLNLGALACRTHGVPFTHSVGFKIILPDCYYFNVALVLTEIQNCPGTQVESLVGEDQKKRRHLKKKKRPKTLKRIIYFQVEKNLFPIPDASETGVLVATPSVKLPAFCIRLSLPFNVSSILSYTGTAISVHTHKAPFWIILTYSNFICSCF